MLGFTLNFYIIVREIPGYWETEYGQEEGHICNSSLNGPIKYSDINCSASSPLPEGRIQLDKKDACLALSLYKASWTTVQKVESVTVSFSLGAKITGLWVASSDNVLTSSGTMRGIFLFIRNTESKPV